MELLFTVSEENALAGAKAFDVSRLRSAEKINSLRLWDRPPFAHEPGYAAYMLWAASKVARAG